MKNQVGMVNFARWDFWTALAGALLIGCGGGGGGGEGAATVPPPAVTSFAYVANVDDNNVSQYAIGADGILAPMSPATVPAGNGPYDVTVDPSRRFAYVPNSGDDNVSQYTIGADGKLVPMSPATVAAGRAPTFVSIDPSGRFAYVTNYETSSGGENVSQYTIGADGKLTPMSPAFVAAGDGPNFIVVDPSGRFAYVVNAYPWPVTNHSRTNNVSQYTIGADGKLAPMSPASVPAGIQPYYLAFGPGGRFIYAANHWDGTVSQYAIGPDGKLTQLSPATVPAGKGPYSVSVDPNGWFAYVTNIHENSVSQYVIGADGKLTPISPASVLAGKGPACVTTTGSVQ